MHSTSFNSQVPGFIGSIGVIAAYSRSFCGTCNRLRITPQGELRTCLYGKDGLNIKDLMRSGYSDDQIEETLRSTISHRYKNGWEAERFGEGDPLIHQSMATIGG
jgi:cyclic pyranopterin phosphate synthase